MNILKGKMIFVNLFAKSCWRTCDSFATIEICKNIGVKEMKACGLVVEYNPFHHGHLYHVQKAKQLTNSDVTIAIMSGSFLQRGEPAIIDKFKRTEAALQAGVDIVLELPYAYAVQSSNLFAKGALLSLNKLGVTSICFGSELGKVEPFIDHIQQMNQKKDQFDSYVQTFMKNGLSYPKSLSAAYEQIGIKNHHVTKPNNILGFHYIKTISDYNLSIEPYTIKRIANEYHHKQIESSIASATSIRAHLQVESNTAPIQHTLPEPSLLALQQYFQKTNKFHDWEDYFPSLYYKIITSQMKDLADIHLMEEGIENRIKTLIEKTTSFEGLMQKLTTSRYTNSRLQRGLTHILTNTSKEEMQQFHREEIPYIRILGMNKQGQAYINQQKKQLDVPLLTKLQRKNAALLKMEERASKTYYSILAPNVRQK